MGATGGVIRFVFTRATRICSPRAGLPPGVSNNHSSNFCFVQMGLLGRSPGFSVREAAGYNPVKGAARERWGGRMGTCRICNATSAFIGRELGVCLPCIRENPRDALSVARDAHARSRAAFGLPEGPPDASAGAPCERRVNGYTT